MINIILAEDHNIVRYGLMSLLRDDPDLNIVAEAENGEEVCHMLQDGIKANILLTDMNMPIIGGIELTQVVKALYPQLNTIILSAIDDERLLFKSFKAGAVGYLLKNVDANELKFAIKHVHSGGQYICSELAVRDIKRVLAASSGEDDALAESVDFTPREIEVISLMAEGLTNQEIADKLFTSKRTVEGYRECMISKARVRNTAALIRYAMLHRLIN